MPQGRLCNGDLAPRVHARAQHKYGDGSVRQETVRVQCPICHTWILVAVTWMDSPCIHKARAVPEEG